MSNLNKVLLFLVWWITVGFMWGCPPESKSIDKNQAWDMVKNTILKDKLEHSIVYQYDQVLKTGQEIKSWGSVQKVPENYRQAWLFFVDQQPGANWGHLCLYIFVDADNGQYTVIKSLSPPDSMAGMTQIYPLSPI